MSTVDDRLLPVFARQHWVACLADIEAAGGTADTAAWRVRTGRWERVDVNVYRLAGVPPSWHGRLLAPVLAIPGAVASHFAAGALHGIDGIGKGIPELSIPRGREHRRRGIRVHTSTDLDRCRLVVVDGIPATDINRTILDLGRTLGDQRLLRAIEWARREDRADWSSLIATLAAHARRGRPGIRRLRRVILANAARGEITDSDFELLVLAMLAEAGMPTPVLHHRLYDGGRLVAEIDLAYVHLKIAIELDGGVHLRPDVREKDLVKQNDLVLAGWIVLRFTYERYRRHPERLVAEIRTAIATAQARAS